jgi:hypothetical protein
VDLLPGGSIVTRKGVTRGQRLLARLPARLVVVRVPGEGAPRLVERREVRATGAELDFAGVERDRGRAARNAHRRKWEYEMRLAVLRRSLGLRSRLVGDDLDAALPGGVF